MNNNQRHIITDLYKCILENGKVGDFVNCYNDTKRAIDELAETDEKLKSFIEYEKNEFEGNS